MGQVNLQVCYWLLLSVEVWIILSIQRIDSQKRTLCPGSLSNVLTNSSKVILFLWFFFLFFSFNYLSERGIGRALSAQTSSSVVDRRTWTKATGFCPWLFSLYSHPTPRRRELFPAKQLTFQAHLLNFIKPFISDLLSGPCFTFHNAFFIIYHSFTFQLRTLAVCKSCPVGGVWNKLLKLL